MVLLVERIGVRMRIMFCPCLLCERLCLNKEFVLGMCVCLLKDGLAEAFTMHRYTDCNVS